MCVRHSSDCSDAHEFRNILDVFKSEMVHSLIHATDDKIKLLKHESNKPVGLG